MSEFYQLIRKTSVPVPEKEPKKKKKKSPKFKKGSWKQWLFKKVKDWKSSRYVQDFHFTKLENVIIADGKNPKVLIFKKRLDKDSLKEIKRKVGDDAFILVNATDRMYMRISLSSYKKLMDIDKVGISFRLRAYYDGEEDVMDICQYERVIDNINDLCKYINYHRQGVEGIYEVQAQCCGYTDFAFQYKILVYKTDGNVETYKGDMNDFMKAYDLYQF